MSKRKKMCFWVGLILVAVLSVGVAYRIHQNNLIKKEKQTLKEEIVQVYEEFEASENKTDILQSFLSENKKYVKYDESEKQYEAIILKMKDYFKSEYNKVIDENTLGDVEVIEDKEQVTTAKNNLISVLETINTSIALTDKEIEKYNADINSLIESYENRIKEIEEYEVEQKAKEEADAKAKAEEEAKKSQNNSNKTNNSNKNNSSNSSGVENENVTNQNIQENAKGPKPAKYSVVRAYDFPNDFPNDGWRWSYATYAWTPNYVSWNWAEEKGWYVDDVVWVVELRSTTSNVAISRAPETFENVKKLMVPAPTLEQSQELIKKDDDLFYVRYGAINVYVCMEE